MIFSALFAGTVAVSFYPWILGQKVIENICKDGE